ncbi:MAG: leucyl/phenylalanyl-tRNA--protein transferase [Formosimonas sp.]
MPHRIPVIHQPDLLPTHATINDGAPNFDDIFAISTQINADWVHTAYQRGLFPWYSQGQPVLWHSPEPRMVLTLNEFKLSQSLRKRLRQWARQPQLGMRVTVNQAFGRVIQACAEQTRRGQNGTWITDEIKAAYTELHLRGQACSVEVWQHERLVAGLYGVLLGRMFFGESMFTHLTDGSKIALACWVQYLAQHEFQIIDCQQETAHLTQLGGAPIERSAFFAQSAALMAQPPLNLSPFKQPHNLLEHAA